MDTHAIEVGVGAVVLAGASGFFGAYLGAWTTARSDRIERARTRRIEAVDELVAAWTAVLFALDTAIQELEALATGEPNPAARMTSRRNELADLITAAVTLSVRVDLLFGAASLPSRNGYALRDQARSTLNALKDGDAVKARELHWAASVSLTWLVNTATDAIESTGTRSDWVRTAKKAMRELPESDPDNRVGPGSVVSPNRLEVG